MENLEEIKNDIGFIRENVLAGKLGVHPTTLDNWFKEGHISKYNPSGRVVMYDIEEVKEFIRKSRKIRVV